MTDPTPALGDVWRYPFLWSREAASGETEGRKERPVVLALLVRNRADELVLLMVPITSVPQSGRDAIEVPEHYNTRRPHSSLGYRPPAPAAVPWPATPPQPASPATSTVAGKPIMH